MIDFARLLEPFPLSEIEWRVGNKTKKGDKATLLPYLTSRGVMKRLDEVIGPEHWRDSYTPINAKQIGFLCLLEVELSPGVWIGKQDGADVSDIESIKGGISDALKRAAVKWGVGRYLYDLPEARYLPIREGYPPSDDTAINCPIGDGPDKKPGHIIIPTLPGWALPGGRPEKKPEEKKPEEKKPEPEKKAESTKPEETKLTRGQKLLARCIKLEEQLGGAKVQDARRQARVAAGRLADLGLTDEQLVAYGTALAGRAAERAAA